MMLTEHIAVLNREVSMPDQSHKGVTFSSTTYGAPTVTIDFSRWVDMRYPNQIEVRISPVPRRPATAAVAEVRKAG